MVLISSIKYACETCIKGHRSSACKHTDRPLFEIKKKGRPVTQCDHCRELRKTKQVHIKCSCERPVNEGPPKKTESATFPNGLPQTLEASVALQSVSETSSDSDHAGCYCISGDSDCHCFVPRKSTRKQNRKLESESITEISSPTPGFKTSAHILARVAEYRPVLPKPPKSDEPHHYHSPPAVHSHRYHPHGHLFSPYERAYDSSINDFINHSYSGLIPSDSPSINSGVHSSHSNSFGDMSTPSANVRIGSTCTCSDGCDCLSCAKSDKMASIVASGSPSSYHTPGACGSCIDCSTLAVHQALPPDTALSIYDYDTQAINDWIRQLSTDAAVTTQIPFISLNSTPHHASTLSRSMCACPPSFCRCQNGRGDTECGAVSFAVSGERASCSAHWSMSPLVDSSMPSYSLSYANISPEVNPNGYLSVPNMIRDRSPSTSSQSSGPSSGQSSVGSKQSFAINQSSEGFATSFINDSTPSNFGQYNSSSMY